MKCQHRLLVFGSIANEVHGMRSRVISANDDDHPPRAQDSCLETKVLLLGSVQPGCWLSHSWIIRSPITAVQAAFLTGR